MKQIEFVPYVKYTTIIQDENAITVSACSMENQRWRDELCIMWRRVMPYVYVILLQFVFSGLTIISKYALKQGLSTFILSVYRHIIAAVVLCPFALFFERKALSLLTPSILLKILILGLLEPVLDQNLFYLGMNCTSAGFAAIMINALPAVTFVLAWILRLERVKLNERRSIAKVVGTILSVSGAMVMTLYKGLEMRIPWIKKGTLDEKEPEFQNSMKGSIFLFVSCISWASFCILQSFTLRSYPWELTLSFLICIAGSVEGSIVAVVVERKNLSVWSIGWGLKFLTVVYAAVNCSALGYLLQSLVIKARGPVFVTAFSPLGMVIVAVAGLLFFMEELFLGRVIGAGLIVLGLYLVVWGMSRRGDVGAIELSGGVGGD